MARASTRQRRKQVNRLKLLDFHRKLVEKIALRKARVQRYNELCSSIHQLRLKVAGLHTRTLELKEKLGQKGAGSEHLKNVALAAEGIAAKLSVVGELRDYSLHVPELFLSSAHRDDASYSALFDALENERDKVDYHFARVVASEVNNGLQVVVGYLDLFEAVNTRVRLKEFRDHQQKINSFMAAIQHALSALSPLPPAVPVRTVFPGRLEELRNFVLHGDAFFSEGASN